MQIIDKSDLTEMYADLAWWFGWSQDVLDDLEWETFLDWIEQAKRQIKAGYVKQ